MKLSPDSRKVDMTSVSSVIIVNLLFLPAMPGHTVYYPAIYLLKLICESCQEGFYSSSVLQEFNVRRSYVEWCINSYASY